MPCPTCDKTMQTLFMSIERTIAVCPTCGTVRSTFSGHVDDMVPALVARCREFAGLGLSAGGDKAAREWHRLGIAESISTPEDRK